MKKKQKINLKYFFSIIISVIAIIVIIYNVSQTEQLKNRISQLESEKGNLESQIDSLNSQITDLNNQIKSKDATISQQQKEIFELKAEVKRLENELRITKQQLEEMTEKYEEAKPYQERVERGQQLSKYYALLNDYEDYAKPIILNHLGLSYPIAPANDDALWERGRQIYNWLSDNYEYCGDKGLRVGTTFYEFQFYSPDELLMSDNVRCGDCDDFATLFAGMMYASGVSESDVWVVCGIADGGGHCWNWLSLSDATYRIDGVCSQKQTIINILGLDLGIKGAYYTSTKTNVDCFSEYNAQMKMNPKGYYTIN